MAWRVRRRMVEWPKRSVHHAAAKMSVLIAKPDQMRVIGKARRPARDGGALLLTPANISDA